MKKIHIGEVLHEVASRHNLSISEIAKRAGYTQSTFYKHIKRADLPYKILYKYAQAMNYFFLKELPDFKKWLGDKGLIDKEGEGNDYEKLKKDRDNWKDKYYILLEKYNNILEQRDIGRE